MAHAPSRTVPLPSVEWFKWLRVETLRFMYRDILTFGKFDGSEDGLAFSALRSIEHAAMALCNSPGLNSSGLDPLHIVNEARKQLQELVDVFEPTPRSFMRMTQNQLSAIKSTKTLIKQLEELPKPVY